MATDPDDSVLSTLASALPSGNGRFFIGIDGADGAGKTTFADEFAKTVEDRGRRVVRIRLDDFHNCRAIRYRRGRDSPEGFWRDTYNYGRFCEWVVEPLSPGGTGLYRDACHNLEADQAITPSTAVAPSNCVVIVDGMFLHRGELDQVFSLSVFLDVPFEETARRMAIRDGSSPDPHHPSLRRYVEGQRRYFAECVPAAKASFVVDNSDFARPFFIDRGSVSYLR